MLPSGFAALGLAGLVTKSWHGGWPGELAVVEVLAVTGACVFFIKKKMTTTTKALSFALLISTAHCASDDIASDTDVGPSASQVQSPPSWDRFMETVRPVGSGSYVVEGDILLPDEQALYDYYEETFLGNTDKSIIDLTASGAWNARSTAPRIGYCFAAGWGSNITFDTNGDGDTTDAGDFYTAPPLEPSKTNIESAMRQWETVANVDFVLMSPATCSNAAAQPAGVSFVVTHYYDGGSGIATGAFPDFSWALQSLSIPTGGLNSVNWAAHEIGHVLGFRHEHIHSGDSSSGAFCTEDTSGDGTADVDGTDFDELTAFDTSSTMKYSNCASSQAVANVAVSALDGLGARAVYGAPASWFVVYGMSML